MTEKHCDSADQTCDTRTGRIRPGRRMAMIGTSLLTAVGIAAGGIANATAAQAAPLDEAGKRTVTVEFKDDAGDLLYDLCAEIVDPSGKVVGTEQCHKAVGVWQHRTTTFSVPSGNNLLKVRAVGVWIGHPEYKDTRTITDASDPRFCLSFKNHFWTRTHEWRNC